MNRLAALPVCTFLLLAAASLSSAQTMDGRPSGSTGTGGGGSSLTGGATPQSTLDLPMAPPKAPVVPPRPMVPEEDEGEDPRDTPAPTIYGEEISSENDTIYYVLDISASMSIGRSAYTTPDAQVSQGSRMDRAKAELTRSIRGLSDNFKFNIVAFDCATETWQSSMQQATDGAKNAAIAWVGALQPRGATGTGPATALALAEKSNMAVVLLTDGAPNCGASGLDGHRVMISTANSQGATINVFGIEASGTYRAFCMGVAADSGGSYFDVP
ncbi:MAG: hypothetical protein AB7N76_05490 [Planctomycetota bacterium]